MKKFLLGARRLALDPAFYIGLCLIFAAVALLPGCANAPSWAEVERSIAASGATGLQPHKARQELKPTAVLVAQPIPADRGSELWCDDKGTCGIR